MQVHLQEGWLNLGHPIADQAADTLFLYHGNRSAPNQGFREHSPEGCVCQDGCRLCSQGCSRVPRAVVQSRVPAVPHTGAVCRGRDSAACQAQHSACPGSCPGRSGEMWGGRSPPAGQGRGLLLPQLLPGQGDHSYAAPQNVSKSTLHKEIQGRDFPFAILREGKRMGG